MIKYELTADMTENRQYCKMMVKTGPQRCGDGLKGEKSEGSTCQRLVSSLNVASRSAMIKERAFFIFFMTIQ